MVSFPHVSSDSCTVLQTFTVVQPTPLYLGETIQQLVATKRFDWTRGIPLVLIQKQHWGFKCYVSLWLTGVLIIYSHQL